MSAQAESAESTESKRDLRYRKSGHSGAGGDVFDQRSGISAGDALTAQQRRGVPAAAVDQHGSQKRSQEKEPPPGVTPEAFAELLAACGEFPAPVGQEEPEGDLPADPLLSKLRGGWR